MQIDFLLEGCGAVTLQPSSQAAVGLCGRVLSSSILLPVLHARIATTIRILMYTCVTCGSAKRRHTVICQLRTDTPLAIDPDLSRKSTCSQAALSTNGNLDVFTYTQLSAQ